ncbi:type II toxin-antitoxin system Phd/YefM family antitoxin [Hippea alviniae]|uniref:type II toxin-antitoxin system Phd/YefM family antitoxin n=1 Tax=Hippea alviniae TaxID=1279027 RepID=UPI0003B6E7BE|nr:type II toxin-antitoxin system Phd/YefM family antitoxin [Hippea alviniae]
METLTASEAKSKIQKLIDEVAESHRPITIKGKKNSVVMLSEEDWRAIEETLYLLNIPGMRESIKEGLETPLEECSKDIEW